MNDVVYILFSLLVQKSLCWTFIGSGGGGRLLTGCHNLYRCLKSAVGLSVESGNISEPNNTTARFDGVFRILKLLQRCDSIVCNGT